MNVNKVIYVANGLVRRASVENPTSVKLEILRRCVEQIVEELNEERVTGNGDESDVVEWEAMIDVICE